MAGKDGQLGLSYITSYMPASHMSKVTSLPDGGGLTVQGRKAGRHNGCIVEAFFLSFPCCARDGEGLAQRPLFSAISHGSCKLPSSDCGAMITLLSASERELGSTKRWSGGQKGRVTIPWASVTHPTRPGAMESIAGVAERHSKSGV